MKPINRKSIKWKSLFASLCIISIGLGTGCEPEEEVPAPQRVANPQPYPEKETADKVFLWDKGDNGLNFWRKAINCGKASQPGGANNTKGVRVRFGVTKEQRFPGTHSVELWTNSNFEERCNQNFTAERAEISSYGKYRELGVKEGQTVWLGWSEKWTDIDESHVTTVIQFRSNCGSGSPATQINLLPGRRLQVRTRQAARYKDIGRIKENVWYDFVVEIKYSKKNDGYIKIWMNEVETGASFSYNNPTAAILNNPTMLSRDGCPHIRWGVYRHQSGDKKPGQIAAKDRMVVKYLGPARIKLGNNLKERGLDAVRPRPAKGGDDLSYNLGESSNLFGRLFSWESRSPLYLEESGYRAGYPM